MKKVFINFKITFFAMLSVVNTLQAQLNTEVYETSAKGYKLTNIGTSANTQVTCQIKILPSQKYQKIIGFGGSFTEASAYLLNKMSTTKRAEIIEAYFGETGARYSLTRTHINSCDFSLGQYSYAPTAGDKQYPGEKSERTDMPYAIVAVIENGGSGSSYAIPVANRVMRALIPE